MTFLLCLVMLQYVCHAKSACGGRHPKLCILHPGKRGFITDDDTAIQAVDFDRTELIQPKWLQEEFAKPGDFEDLFRGNKADNVAEDDNDDVIPFIKDRTGYNQGWFDSQ